VYINSILGIYQVAIYSKQVYTCDFTRVSTSGFTSRVVTWMQTCALEAVKREKKTETYIRTLGVGHVVEAESRENGTRVERVDVVGTVLERHVTAGARRHHQGVTEQQQSERLHLLVNSTHITSRDSHIRTTYSRNYTVGQKKGTNVHLFQYLTETGEFFSHGLSLS